MRHAFCFAFVYVVVVVFLSCWSDDSCSVFTSSKFQEFILQNLIHQISTQTETPVEQQSLCLTLYYLDTGRGSVFKPN